MSKQILAVFLIFVVSATYGYSTGAPKEACGDMKPQHPFNPKETEFPYKVTVSKTTVNKSGKLTIKIEGKKEKDFKGFLVQVRDNSGPIGSFSIPATDLLAKTLDCGAKNAAATHKTSDKKEFVELQWVAPTNYNGKLTVYTTVAKDGETYWVKQKGNEIQVV